MNIRHSNLRFAAVLVFAAGSLLIAGLLLPPLPLFITDNGNKYMIMRDFAESATLFMDHIEPALFPKGGFHFQTLPDGRIYSFHSWVLPVLSSFFYTAAGENAALLPVWLSGLGIFLLLTDCKKARFAAWALLLTTPVWLYSLMLWEMVPSALAVLAAFLLLKKRRMLFAGTVLGLGIWFREEVYIISGIIGALILCRRQWKDAALLACGGLLALLPLWLTNFLIYGHILGLHGATYALNNRTGFSLSEEISGIFFNYYQHLLRFETLSPQKTSVLSLIGAAALLLPGLMKNGKIKLAGLAIFGMIDLIFIWNIFHSPSPLFTCGLTMSLFFSLPLAAGYFINLRQLLGDENRFIRFTAQAVTIYIFAVPPLLTRFDIGLTFGARHYICIMPLMMILSFRGFAKMAYPVKVKQLFMIIFAVAGIALQIWGFKVLSLTSAQSADLEKYIAAHMEKVVISDLFYLPEQAPRIFFDKTFMEVATEKQTEIFFNYLAENRIEEFILILSRGNNFRRIDNNTLGKILTAFPPAAPPVEADAAPGMPLFIVRCRKAAAQAGQ